jgi:outer membrane protein assembly factor BamC
MFFKNYSVLILIPLVLVSCAETEKSRYKDTSHLEMPPELEIIETEKVAVSEYEKLTNTGLGDDVLYEGSAGEPPVMKIKKLFDRSWDLIEQALKLSEIEITDKNREQGFFYVNFDPDARDSKDAGILDGMSFFFFVFFVDEYAAAAYKLKVGWAETNTEVTAELVDQVNTDLLDDDEDMEDFEGSVDDGAMLLKKLYKTIRDDLPLD